MSPKGSKSNQYAWRSNGNYCENQSILAQIWTMVNGDAFTQKSRPMGLTIPQESECDQGGSTVGGDG